MHSKHASGITESSTPAAKGANVSLTEQQSFQLRATPTVCEKYEWDKRNLCLINMRKKTRVSRVREIVDELAQCPVNKEIHFLLFWTIEILHILFQLLKLRLMQWDQSVVWWFVREADFCNLWTKSNEEILFKEEGEMKRKCDHLCDFGKYSAPFLIELEA